MKISIAMATYNGAKYLRQQLDSFANQTRLPDELVICDDGSNDDTLVVLQTFAKSAPFDVRIYKNENNLGYTKNFEKSILLCSGDIIFISDQDDVWFIEKLDFIRKCFLNNLEAMVIINDQEITDRNLKPSGVSIMGNTKALGFDESWLSAGCCTAIRSTFRKMIVPFPDNLQAYDGWIHRIAMAMKVRQVVPVILQKYRRHDANTSTSMASCMEPSSIFTTIRNYGLRDVTEGWKRELCLSEYLQYHLDESLSSGKCAEFKGKVLEAISLERRKCSTLLERMAILKRGRFARFPYAVRYYIDGGYFYFAGWRSLAKDLVRPPIQS